MRRQKHSVHCLLWHTYSIDLSAESKQIKENYLEQISFSSLGLILWKDTQSYLDNFSVE